MSKSVPRTQILKNNLGATLIEMVISLVIVTIGFMGIYTVLVNSDIITKGNRKETESIADFSLMKLSLTKVIPRLYFGQVFLNQTVIGSLIDSSFSVDAERGSYYSIIPFHQKAFAAPPVAGTPLTFTNVGEEYEMIAFLGPRDEHLSLTVAENPLNPTAPYDFTDPDILSGVLTVTGDLSTYQPGELLALNGAQGTQIIRVNSITGQNLTFETMGPIMVGYYESNMPLGVVTKGNQITKLNVYLLGIEATTKNLYFLRTNPGNNTFEVLNRMPEKVTSLLVNGIITKTRFGMDIAPLSTKAILKATMQLEGKLKNSRRAADLQFLF